MKHHKLSSCSASGHFSQQKWAKPPILLGNIPTERQASRHLTAYPKMRCHKAIYTQPFTRESFGPAKVDMSLACRGTGTALHCQAQKDLPQIPRPTAPGWMCAQRRAEARGCLPSWDTAPLTCPPGCPENHHLQPQKKGIFSDVNSPCADPQTYGAKMRNSGPTWPRAEQKAPVRAL